MSCQIFIENSSGYFYPGSYIDGRVICSFSEQKNIRGIKLTLKGKEHTEWTKGSGRSRSYYKGNNIFLQNELNLQGEGSVGPGRCEYPFKLNLPNTCPGTFVLEDNFIRYTLKAVVDIPFLPDYEDKLTLTVIAPIDFNTQMVNMNPIGLRSEKTLLCLWCASAPITLNLFLEKQAYVLGETIKFKIHCSNLSNENITALTCTLTKIIKLTANYAMSSGYSKDEKQVLASLNAGGVGAHGERDYDLELPVPQDVNLPNFSMCTLFELICTFKVTAVLPSFHRNFDVEATITLGNISLNRQPGAVPVPVPHPDGTAAYNSYAPTVAPPEEGRALLQRGISFN